LCKKAFLELSLPLQVSDFCWSATSVSAAMCVHVFNDAPICALACSTSHMWQGSESI